MAQLCLLVTQAAVASFGEDMAARGAKEPRFVSFADLLEPNGRETYNRTLDFASLAQYRGAVFWPNDMTLVLFYELYSMGMPIFVPLRFWRHLRDLKATKAQL